MKLNELLENVEVLNILGDTEVEITGVNIDSRKIEKGHLFIAIPGSLRILPQQTGTGCYIHRRRIDRRQCRNGCNPVLWKPFQPTETRGCNGYKR